MADKLQRLFAVESDEEREYSKEMTDLSRAFGILLHTATNSESSTVVSNICETVSALSGNISKQHFTFIRKVCVVKMQDDVHIIRLGLNWSQTFA